MSEDANVGILFFDTENRGQNAEILNNGLTLRRKESYWYGSAWCPHAIPLRSIKINDKFEQAYGFTIVMREMSIEGWSGNVKFGFTNKPVTTNLVTAHISEVQPSCTLEFDSANRRQGKTNPAASWSRYNLRLSHLEAQGDKISGRVSPAINVGDRLSLFFLPGSSELVFLFNDKLESRCSLLWGVPVEEQEFYALVESYGTFSTTQMQSNQSLTHSLAHSLMWMMAGQVQAVDLEPIFLPWTPETHHMFPTDLQQAIKTIATLALVNSKSEAQIEGSPWFVLPPELLFMMYSFISASHHARLALPSSGPSETETRLQHLE